MAAMAGHAPSGRKPEEEIAAIRAARAAKKAQALEDEADEGGMVGSHTLSYSFQEHTIAIEEDWSGDGSALAGLQWVGGATLARFFDDRARFPTNYFAGKTVCEFGAGVGLTSILLALLGAEVALTDLDCDKAVVNVESNLTTPEERRRLSLIELDWYHPNTGALSPPYDILVAGDCCYEAAVIDPLLRVMWDVSNENTEIYLCGIVGKTALRAFNAAVGRYFAVERVQSSGEHVELGRRANIDDAGDDNDESRLRALMRLYRREAIQAEPVEEQHGTGNDAASSSQVSAVDTPGKKPDSILLGPTFLFDELEVHVCRCPRLLYREIRHVFPTLNVPAETMLAIPTNQVSLYFKKRVARASPPFPLPPLHRSQFPPDPLPPFLQHSAMELVKVGEEVEGEKDRCLIVVSHVSTCMYTCGY
jgi:predicted nicotinamide N-methyase